MLTPEYLDALPDEAAALWRTVEDDILRDVARRIGKAGELTDTADHQAWRLEQTQALRGDVVKTLARYSGRSDAVMRRLLQQAGRDALAADDAAYRAAGLTPGPINDDAALLNLLNAGYRQTRGTWKNLTATTARTVTRQFEAALDRAWLQVSSGAFDYKTAIKRAVDGLAGDMKYITYPGGRRDTLEVAVRRAVLTGVNQTASKLQLARAEEMGCEFAEVSAHAGARPSHAEWQGKVYHIGGAVTVDGVRYEGFEAATHYGAGDGLCGWNCRHNFHPFFPGLSKRSYSDEELARLKDDADGADARRQRQRELERKVRAAKRQYLAEDAAGLDAAGAKAQWQRAQRELAAWKKEVAAHGEFGSNNRLSTLSEAQTKRFAEFIQQNRATSLEQLLPNYSHAKIPSSKLSGYCLNMESTKGRDKAIAFRDALGYTVENEDELKAALRNGLKTWRATERTSTNYGRPFEVKMLLTGPNGKQATVKTAWQIDVDSDVPRLISAYIY